MRVRGTEVPSGPQCFSLVWSPHVTDTDGDGYLVYDCDNNNPDVHPGAEEINDGVDNQCAGDPGYSLVDEIGGQYQAVKAAAIAGGIKGKPSVIEYRKAGWFESVFGTSGASAGIDRAVERELLDRLLRQTRSPRIPR